jgi:hypothetical protein
MINDLRYVCIYHGLTVQILPCINDSLLRLTENDPLQRINMAEISMIFIGLESENRNLSLNQIVPTT